MHHGGEKISTHFDLFFLFFSLKFHVDNTKKENYKILGLVSIPVTFLFIFWHIEKQLYSSVESQ
jgi:hypothetical protein